MVTYHAMNIFTTAGFVLSVGIVRLCDRYIFVTRTYKLIFFYYAAKNAVDELL